MEQLNYHYVFLLFYIFLVIILQFYVRNRNTLNRVIPAIITAATLLIGAVRTIPQSHLRLEILDSQAKRRKRKEESKITSSGHAIVPHYHSAAISINAIGGGVQTVILIKDKSTRNTNTTGAHVTGLNGQVLANLSFMNRKVLLPSLGIALKYIPPKNIS